MTEHDRSRRAFRGYQKAFVEDDSGEIGILIGKLILSNI